MYASNFLEVVRGVHRLAPSKILQSVTEDEWENPPFRNVQITENQFKVIKDKYLRDDPDVETWLWRIAKNIALAELLYIPEFKEDVLEGVSHYIEKRDVGNGEISEMLLFHRGFNSYNDWNKNHKKFIENCNSLCTTNLRARAMVLRTARQFYDALANFDFLPNSPTLMNAGRELQQLSACYVLPIEDSIEGWGDVVKHTMIIHKSGGGTGFSACKVRPRGSAVKSTKGIASGALSPFAIINHATEHVKQGGCVAPDTMIATSFGTVPIKELGMANEKEWQHIQLKVQTDEGLKNADEFYNNGFSRVLKVTTKKGYSITMTPEHRIRVIDGQGSYVWKHAKDLKDGDWSALQKEFYVDSNYVFPQISSKPHKNAKKVYTPLEPTAELCELIGYFIGDGCLHNNRLILAIPHSSRELVGYFAEKVKTIFGIGYRIEQKPNDKSLKFIFQSTELCRWWNAIGANKHSSKNAEVPKFIFRTKKLNAQAFIRGLFEADGTVSKEGRIEFVSVSKKLIEQVQLLLLSLGIPSSVGISKPNKAFSDSLRYRLRILTKDGYKKFKESVGFITSNKSLRIRVPEYEMTDIIPNISKLIRNSYAFVGRGSGMGRSSRGANKELYRDIGHYVNDDRNVNRSRLQLLVATHKELQQERIQQLLSLNQFYDQIETIEEFYSETLDLSVPENNTYIANGFVSHNTRRGANMGILPYWHPDIIEFVKYKAEEGKLENFNISVAADSKFMEYVKEGKDYDLINPKTKEAVGKLNAAEVFDLMCEYAWKTGDPGMVWLDAINNSRSNTTPEFGEIESTNPCGEQPLLPYEPCNLASINLSKFVVRNEIDWARLEAITKLAVKFLDQVIDVNNYPIPQIEHMAKGNRRIGLGIMGWAEMLVMLGVPYDGDEAFAKAEEVMGFINEKSLEASEEMARERGLFPFFKNSHYDKEGKYPRAWAAGKPRNCARTTIAPTGTIAIAAGLQGSGIEPFFGIAYIRYNAKALDALKNGLQPNEGDVFYEVNPLFRKIAEENNHFGLKPNELWKKVQDNHCSVRGINEIPEKIQKLFCSAHDLVVEYHVRIQSAFQKYTDNGVSKTINMPSSATVDEVKRTYMYAWELGCKGITVYRDGCKSQQVLNFEPKKKQQEATKITEDIDMREGVASLYYKLETGYGPVHIHIDHLDGKPFRVFTNTTPIGTEVAGLTTALGILLSKYLENGGDINEVRRQLNSIKSDKPFGFGPNRIESIPHAISVSLTKFLAQQGKLQGQQLLTPIINKEAGLKEANGNLGIEHERKTEHCPKCYSPNIAYLSGCSGPTCYDCGYAECS